MASPSLATVANPTTALFRPRSSAPSPSCSVSSRLVRAPSVVTRAQSAAASGNEVEASTDGKHHASAMAALDNCVTSSNLSFGTKYEVGVSHGPWLADL